MVSVRPSGEGLTIRLVAMHPGKRQPGFRAITLRLKLKQFAGREKEREVQIANGLLYDLSNCADHVWTKSGVRSRPLNDLYQ